MPVKSKRRMAGAGGFWDKESNSGDGTFSSADFFSPTSLASVAGFLLPEGFDYH
jgi:hypothetical protein